MVKPLYLCSLKERSGKSFLSIGIIQKLKKEGKKFAYFKPIGCPKGAFTLKSDKDIDFILRTVYKDKNPYDMVCPISIPDAYYIDLIDADKKVEYLDKIKATYKEVIKGVDYVLIEGAPSIKKFVRVGIDDVSIAKALGIDDLIYVCSESSDMCIDNICFTKNYFKFREVNLSAVIFNNIDFEYIPRIKELSKEHIDKFNIPILGIIERSIKIFSPRVMEVLEAIGGELINEIATEGLNNTVETIIIGAMNTQAALKYLRQVKKAAVITGGDRADLALAALNEDVSVLILTGFIQPDAKVVNVANEKKIPIILSPSDTYTTMRNLERLKPGIQDDEIQEVLDLMEDQIDWEFLLKS